MRISGPLGRLTESEQLPGLSEEAEVKTTGVEYGCLAHHHLFEVSRKGYLVAKEA